MIESRSMLITFFDSKEFFIHKEFALFGQTVTGNYYLEILKRLMVRIRRICPEYRDPESWSLLHDKRHLTIHSLFVNFWRNQVCVFNHPPYSLDLASYDFSLFKIEIKIEKMLFRRHSDHPNSFNTTLEAP